MIELHDLGQHDLHDDEIHEGQTGELPVFGVGADQITQFFGACDGDGEQTCGKGLVFVGGIGGQQRLVGTIGRVEALDGFHHKGIDNLFVVVPIETLLFKQRIEVFVVDDVRLVEFTNDLTIGVIVFVFVVDITLEEFVVDPKVVDLFHQILIVGEEDLLLLGKFFKFLIFCQLRKEPIFNDHLVIPTYGRGSQPFHSRLTSGFSLYGTLPKSNQEQQQHTIQVIGFLEAEFNLFQSHFSGFSFILIVRVNQLYDLQTDKCTIYHSRNSIYSPPSEH